MISLTVEQFEYIYCGGKIREAAGHLSFITVPIPDLIRKSNRGFLAKVWVHSSKIGLDHSPMFLTVTWRHMLCQ